MFGDGWTEILIIVIVATVVIGPKDLPRVLRMVGRLMGTARTLTGNLQGQMREAIRQAEVEASIGEVRRAVNGAGSAVVDPGLRGASPVSSLRQDLSDALAPLLQPATGSGYVFPKLDSRPLLLYPKAASCSEDSPRVPDYCAANASEAKADPHPSSAATVLESDTPEV